MSSKPTKRTTPFSMRMDPQLKAALEAQAEVENRSLTNYVETLLWQAVERREPDKCKGKP